ncbi:MAG: DUF4493 domain-containing protein [Alistipes sp.]
MKQFIQLLIPFSVLLLFAAGCADDEPNYAQHPDEDLDPVPMVGYVSAAAMQVTVLTDAEVMNDRMRAAAEVPATDTYIIEIRNLLGDVVAHFNYGEKPQTLLKLPVGNYTLYAASGEIPDAAWDTPVYAATRSFSVCRADTVRLQNLICTPANIKVSVGYPADLVALVSDDAQAEVALGAHKLTFAKNETRTAYFKAAGESNTLTLTAKGRLDGNDFAVNKSVEGVKAGQWHKMEVALELALRIEWVGYDLSVRHTITPDMTAVVNVSAKEGIAGFSVDIISDILTPEILNMVGLSTHLDLVNPASPEMGEMLKQLGFPVGADVLNQTAVSFDITQFMPLIPQLSQTGGYADFKLTITDRTGKSIVKSLMVKALPPAQ